MSFAALKKNRGKSTDKLTEALNKLNSNSYEDDGSYWKVTRDKSGNGFAVIRFLPAGAKDGDDAAPWVRYWDHFFKGPTGKYYVAKSLTTLGQPDPVAEANGKIWNVGKIGEDKIRKEQRKRNLHYVSNILVLNDPANPDNNGKVFKFRYGQKIFDKIAEKMQPSFEGEEKVNPFDLWDGANFKLKVRNNEHGYPNYDASQFDPVSPIEGDDKKLEAIYNQCYSLQEEISADKFKTYDELTALLKAALGNTDEIFLRTNGVETAVDKATADAPAQKSRKPVEKESVAPFAGDDDGDEDEDTSFFERISR